VHRPGGGEHASHRIHGSVCRCLVAELEDRIKGPWKTSKARHRASEAEPTPRRRRGSGSEPPTRRSPPSRQMFTRPATSAEQHPAHAGGTAATGRILPHMWRDVPTYMYMTATHTHTRACLTLLLASNVLTSFTHGVNLTPALKTYRKLLELILFPKFKCQLLCLFVEYLNTLWNK